MHKINSYFLFSRSLIYISLSFSILFSQVSFTAADISTSATEAISVFAADMDGDGDMDIENMIYMVSNQIDRRLFEYWYIS